MLTVKKTMWLKLMGIFFWTVLLFGATLTGGMVADAGAVFYFSRACSSIGTMESGTWNGGLLLGGSFKTNSKHVERGDRSQGIPRTFHLQRGTWTGEWDFRAVTGHYFSEYYVRPLVRGYHWMRNPATSRPRLVRRSRTRQCFFGPDYPPFPVSPSVKNSILSDVSNHDISDVSNHLDPA